MVSVHSITATPPSSAPVPLPAARATCCSAPAHCLTDLLLLLPFPPLLATHIAICRRAVGAGAPGRAAQRQRHADGRCVRRQPRHRDLRMRHLARGHAGRHALLRSRLQGGGHARTADRAVAGVPALLSGGLPAAVWPGCSDTMSLRHSALGAANTAPTAPRVLALALWLYACPQLASQQPFVAAAFHSPCGVLRTFRPCPGPPDVPPHPPCS